MLARMLSVKECCGCNAVVLAVLGAIDSLLTSLVADSLTSNYHDSNRELVGQVPQHSSAEIRNCDVCIDAVSFGVMGRPVECIGIHLYDEASIR